MGILFANELIQAGLDFQEERVKRTLGPVTRTQIKFSRRGRSWFECPRSSHLRFCPCPTAQSGRNDCGPRGVAEVEKKVAPLKIDGLRRFSYPTQSNVSLGVTRGSEANIRVWTGQGEAGRSLPIRGLRQPSANPRLKAFMQPTKLAV